MGTAGMMTARAFACTENLQSKASEKFTQQE